MNHSIQVCVGMELYLYATHQMWGSCDQAWTLSPTVPASGIKDNHALISGYFFSVRRRSSVGCLECAFHLT